MSGKDLVAANLCALTVWSSALGPNAGKPIAIDLFVCYVQSSSDPFGGKRNSVSGQATTQEA